MSTPIFLQYWMLNTVPEAVKKFLTFYGIWMFNTVFTTAVQWFSPHTNGSCLLAFSRHTPLIYYRTPICNSWFGSAEKSQKDCMFKQCTISCTIWGAKSAIIILFPPLVSLANIHIQVHKPNVCLVRVMGSHESCTWPFHMCSATVHTQVTCLHVKSCLSSHATTCLVLISTQQGNSYCLCHIYWQLENEHSSKMRISAAFPQH